MSLSGYGKDPYGTGPYGSVDGVIVSPPHPVGAGYGGAPYGYGPYGSTGITLPLPPVDGGYGGKAYGLGSYGCIGAEPPKVINAISVTGFQIEVFFNQDMLVDSSLLDPTSYTLIDITGAAPAVVLSVEEGVQGNFGPTSVLLNHTGTTLGGVYEIVVVGPQSASGGGPVEANAPCNRATVLAKGEPPAFTVTPISGNELRYDFDQDMLPESQFTPGIEDLDAYVFETQYPVPLIPQAATFPYAGNDNQVKLDVLGMTSAEYTAIVGPAEAIVYVPEVLPGDDPGFQSQEIGSGSSLIQNDKLLLSTPIGNSYGYRFADISGKILPNSSFRIDFEFDAASAGGIFPSTDGTYLSLLVSDGAVGVTITLKRILGMDFVEIQSGAFFSSGAQNWSSGPTEISLVRNQKADTYTVVVGGEPFISSPTAALNGAAGIPSGLQFTLDPLGAYNVVDFPVLGVRFTSSQTVFSAAWNFLHQQASPFLGDDSLTKGSLLTKKGPLVKGWGDATLANINDVHVYVNGIEVAVGGVNPYIGEITPEIPIPLMPPGLMEVTVDYIWFYNPILPMGGLNTQGVVLNQATYSPLCPTSTDVVPKVVNVGGSVSRSRFAYTLALNGRSSRQPTLRSPRFVGFQKSYTAALNSPTTLQLNQDNHKVALPAQERSPEGEVVFYEATEDPTEADPSWTQVGESSLPPEVEPSEGQIVGGTSYEFAVEEADNLDDGTFLVQKGVSGPYQEGDVYFFKREVDFSFDSTFVYVARFQVTDDIELAPDGVFTGVGFGVSTNNHLYLVGALLINGVQHIGLLNDPGYPEQQDSWSLAYEQDIQILGPLSFSIPTEDLPLRLQQRVDCKIESKIQVLEGPQTGVYNIVEIIDLPDGRSEVILDESTPFPADSALWGNAECTCYFETRWDGEGGGDYDPVTYRLVVKHDIKLCPKGRAELFVGGSLSGLALVAEGAPAFAIPPDGVLLYPTGEEGLVFFGSLDRRASNSSRWSFTRYALEPAQTTINFRGIVAAAEMASLPEEDPNNIWFLTQEFGSREIRPLGNPNLLLKSTSASNNAELEGQDLTLGYARIEPFLTRKISIDVDAEFQVDSGVLGAGDAEIIVRDGTAQVLLATILYEESLEDRQLLSLPNTSLSGLLLPDQQSWVKSGTLNQERVQGQRIEFQQLLGEQVKYDFDFLEEYDALPDGGRVVEVRMIASVTTSDPLGNTGIYVAADVGDVGASRGIGMQLRSSVGGADAQVFLFSTETGIEVASFDFPWEDGEEHTYRFVADPLVDAVSLVVDDQVLGTSQVSLFDLSTTEAFASLAFSGTTTSSEVTLEDMSVSVTPPPTAKRTLGVWLGGDKNDINNWELPRTDSETVDNSDLLAVIEEFDWRSLVKVRIHRDPEWGVTILRPDLPPPPYFVGEQFATQITEPSAGWINVEYRHLPAVEDRNRFGYVTFGALEPLSVTQQRWNQVRYRIYDYASEDIIAPHHMLLNQYNVVNSGECLKDTSVETVTVLSRDSRTIKISDSHIYADRVFNFFFTNSAGEQVLFEPPSFTFDPDTQVITIDTVEDLGFQPSLDTSEGPSVGITNPTLEDTEWPYPNEGELFDTLGVSGAEEGSTLSTNPPELTEPVQVPVTINFAPGNPKTLTYVCSQPLLDGVTLLNQDTPYYTKSLVGSATPELEFGSKINDPNDTLNNDPDFISNDPYRFINFTQDANCEYEEISFCEVSEGEDCLLSPFCDDNIPGASCAPAEGGTAEPGDIGNGLISMELGGLAFTEVTPISFSDGPEGPFGGPSGSGFLKASGGDAPEGGELQDSLIFYPTGPGVEPSGEGFQGAGVIGILYDTVTNTSTTIRFTRQP